MSSSDWPLRRASVIDQKRGQRDGFFAAQSRACSNAVRATRRRCSCSASAASLRSTSADQRAVRVRGDQLGDLGQREPDVAEEQHDAADSA
ncbi:MAG: hypothetical protein ACRDQW_14160 [Haloechinothrix sp.]